MYNLDQTDLQILKELKENSRITTKELAARVNLSSTPVYDRVKKLEKEGIIKGYVAVLDYEKLNRGFGVYCNIKLKLINPEIALRFVNFISEIPEVTECYNISGEYDYLLKIQAPDMKYYQSFLINTLGKFDGIAGIHSVFIMEVVK
ncbi:MAG: Lrp/AsnC family transcriptional regulator [Dysgonamonadaceae bacterium]|jgi:Lrp/AsnC family leucine-responsive transcriptional regulator|nr:Lrp/AsnC family transcriptional regulator [Dysgonamonadaceae bacterium]MDD3308757.1 Lrp/AsnC family transcriptional regulator [Dysgonamonadaceae bacterium]MDD3900934.1 Lrp/AsnC family transcriptional regulator [Dysgonamonadaceae bacterium]MDD4398332.1 Lrp/AsnC family transcriptional regulator [Dysgonamonadaceae bacterium]MEA5080794.1 Lrp/AsnC family transcriptional regulator [Dysgonamonadaceae bacterium]